MKSWKHKAVQAKILEEKPGVGHPEYGKELFALYVIGWNEEYIPQKPDVLFSYVAVMDQTHLMFAEHFHHPKFNKDAEIKKLAKECKNRLESYVFEKDPTAKKKKINRVIH